MHEIKSEELERIKGGGVSPWIVAGFGAIIVFLIGVYDGFTRPLTCNDRWEDEKYWSWRRIVEH